MFKSKLISSTTLIVIFTVCLSSCVSTKDAIYFDNIRDKEFIENNIEPVIQKSDLLSITVSSLNPEATVIFNTPGNNNNSQTGYLVNSDGYILFPILGKINVAGLTVKQFTADLTNTLVSKKLLVDPIVNVRITNFRVTVLGEVTRPTVVPVPNEKISMLEAIGQAGDLTLYAQRDKVLLIRVENGKRITRRINLSSPDFLESPFYYLKTNDIVYVEPNKAKVATARRSQQLLPLVMSGLTFVIIVIDRLLIK